MQLSYGFSTLLVSILAVASFVDARPTPGNAGMVTLPLRSVPQQRRSDVHPHIYLQQHTNRAIKRHARMTGREVPSKRELGENIMKRAIAIEADGASSGLSKRLFTTQWAKDKIAAFKAQKGKAHAGKTAAHTGKKAAAAGKKAATAAGKNTTATLAAKPKVKTNVDAKTGKIVGEFSKGGNGNATAAGDDGGADANSTADQSGAGFNQIDLDAANNGGLTAANAPTDSNSLGLDVEANDVGYIATVQLGTPPREFKVLMDSGSADFWVGSENCTDSTNGGDCGNHTFLGTQSSSTFADTGAPFAVTYGSGNVAGTIINDNVVIAGLPLNNHTFGVADQESDDFAADTVPFDGLMGVAQSTLSQQQVPTPPESLASSGAIKEAIVSFKLSRISDQKNDGEVTFGGLDASKFDANTLVTFDNVNTQGFWEGPFTLKVDGTDLGLQGRTGILDTGTSLVLGPTADIETFHDSIPGAKPDGQGGFTIPCTTSAKVAFNFAGQDFELNPLDLLFVPVDQTNLQGDCVSAFTSGQIGGATEWLLGDVFLKNAYFSTNVGKNSVSLAQLT